MEGHGSVFVKISEYEEVVNILENIKKKVKESHDILAKLNELKAEEDRELLAWNESLDDITNRIGHIEKSLNNQ